MGWTLVYVYRVIVADIVTRNSLLDSNYSVKMSGFFGIHPIFPLTSDTEVVDDAGYSIFADIGQMGAMMYNAVTGKACGSDIF
jgi:hypothetical protein